MSEFKNNGGNARRLFPSNLTFGAIVKIDNIHGDFLEGKEVAACPAFIREVGFFVVVNTTTFRGSGWAVLALGGRLALGAATSIFLAISSGP